ncbi:MAG: SDR family NAD(P)-dependent oxidoreductase [Paludisphaera borealis]|uniref:SDR family NAD(P)-dependent oxidoreductase n=1 Tax=Paludisphaera borealis TaxID=1387353 RepID=UPI00284E07DD|nr:SDR family NAD(P)-dependent oxidoreductase [Paludisphaera borealis]MDR3621987.1 SDR family NAD(P)-dependent oxidoreductase [Paludisphaera borealis]
MSHRRSWNDTRALVTGASSGLGRAIAEHLVHLGATVVLTGRSAAKLDAVAHELLQSGAAPERIITVAADLTVDIDRQRLFDEIANRLGALDLVVNNAGVGATGQFDTHDPWVLRRVFEINFFAMAEVCRAALPLLSEGTAPMMVVMGSVNARRGLPGRVEYSASKFAVSGFTESIRIEWRRFGIHVLQVNPGFSATSFDDNAVVKTARVSVSEWRTMPADAVALATLRAVERRKREITLTTRGRLLVVMNRLAPRFVDWGLARWLLRHFPDAPSLHRKKPASQAS